MSKYIFIIACIIFGLNLEAQNDTISILENEVPFINNLFEIPLSENVISKLEFKNNIIEESNVSNYKSYLFLFLLNLFTISVLLLDFSRIKVKKIVATLFNINILKQYSKVEAKRDNNYLAAYFVLVAIFVVVIIFVMSNLFALELEIFKVGLIIVSFFIIDILIDKTTAYITDAKEIYTTVVFNNASFFIILLPILIIGILLLVFLPEYISKNFSYVYILFIFVFYFWKEIRNGLILASSKIKVVSFYFFLYLCTFKILPFIILIKVIMCEIIK